MPFVTNETGPEASEEMVERPRFVWLALNRDNQAST